MMAEQVYRSIAAEGKQIPTWDVESILTRAVYRALNSGDDHLVNVERRNFPVNIDKHRSSTDAQLQLRLIAEKLCTRVERRYEKRLLQQRERDRMATDRMLANIRTEYSEQLEMRRKELERERLLLEEQFAEKDRLLRHKLELQLSDKESALELTRKSLENRLAELAMNKSQLDRAKAEFHAKFTSDVEMLNQEWAKIEAKQDELRKFYREEFKAEYQDFVFKSETLEKENAVLKKKLVDCNAELYHMRSQLTRMASLEEDLKAANERIRSEVEERHRLLRCNYEAERLKDENALLKEELEHLKSATRLPRVPPLSNAVRSFADEVYLLKISELRNVVRMMGQKINSLTSERDHLRHLLRGFRREIAIGHTRGSPVVGGSRDSRPQITIRESDSSEDTSISSSSTCASDLGNLKKRFSNLENLAKSLDTTIDCVVAARSAHGHISLSPDVLSSENYDDFCRSLKQNMDRYSSPKKAVENENDNLQRTNVGNNADHSRKEAADNHDDHLDGKIAALCSDQGKAIDNTTVPQNNRNERSFSVIEGPKTTVARMPVAEEVPTVPNDATSTFADKLKARNDAKRELTSAVLLQKEAEEEEKATAEPATDSNAMTKYLALLTSKRQERRQQQPSGTKLLSDIDLNEIEDVDVDREQNSADEIDW